MTSGRDLSFWASLLVAFFLMLRISNLLPKFVKTQGTKHLLRSNFSVGKNIALVKLHWSKTMQFGQRSLVLPLARMPGSPLCPVYHIKELFERFQTGRHAPAFSYFQRGKIVFWTEKSWVDYLRKKLQPLVQNVHDFSGHSFRRGGATFAFSAGIPSELIQLQGDWRSDAYKEYLHCSLQDKTRAALLIRDYLNRQLNTPFN